MTVKCPTVSDIATSFKTSAPAIINALAAKYDDVLNFAIGEPKATIPYDAEQMIKDAIWRGMTHYSPVAGLPTLRKCINYDAPENVVVFGGSKACIFTTLLATVNRGDEVIIPAPYWPSYKYAVEAVGAVPVIIESGVDALKRAVTKKTKMFIFNNPNNPSGKVATTEEARGLGQICLDNNIWILEDAIYDKITYVNDVGNMRKLFPDITLEINGVSKAYSMAGIRVGWVIAPNEDVANAIIRISSHCSGQANTPGQKGAIGALAKGENYLHTIRRHYMDNRNYLVGCFEDWGRLEFVRPDGAFYLMFNCEENDVDFCMRLLEEKHMALTPCEEFGAPGWIRWCFTGAKKDIKEGF